MKALIELHFQHVSRFIENVLRSTLSYPNKTSKECIQFLNKHTYVNYYSIATFQIELKQNKDLFYFHVVVLEETPFLTYYNLTVC
jgi:hypothetical protein